MDTGTIGFHEDQKLSTSGGVKIMDKEAGKHQVELEVFAFYVELDCI